MLKYFILLFLLLIGFSKTYVFYLEKYYMQLQKESKQLKKDINLLKIEWTYLNQPQRLIFLSNKFLMGYKRNDYRSLIKIVKNHKCKK